MATNKQPTTTAADNAPTIYAPIAGKPTNYGGFFGDDRGDHIHAGLDISCSLGTPCIAPVDGKIVQFAVDNGFAPSEGAQGGGGMIQFEFQEDLGPIKKGDVIGWGHVFHVYASVGQSVKAGQKIASSGVTTFNGAEHVHFVAQSPANGDMDGSVDPLPYYKYLITNGKDTSGFQGSGPASNSQPGGGALTEQDVFAISRAGALSTQFELPGIMNFAEANLLTGDKALMNDIPLFEFIQQLASSSLRHFQSLPNGDFFAFFPDYFGNFGHRKPYWLIDDIEVLSGGIDLNDESVATHVYVVGDVRNPDQNIDVFERIFSKGTITILDALATGLIQGGLPEAGTSKFANLNTKSSQTNKDKRDELEALSFLTRYGARPLLRDEPLIRNYVFEVMTAINEFSKAWSSQFATDFAFTFMPELYPGGIVGFKDHGVQCYIESVVHSFDYESGFSTQATLSSPAALGDTNNPISRGMIRPLDASHEQKQIQSSSTIHTRE